MHAYRYKTNFLVDLGCWIMYEVLYCFIYCGNLDTRWVLLSADLTCFAREKTLLLPHLKQVYNEFSRVFLWFFKLSYKTFHVLSSRIKNRVFKNWVCFLLIFSVLLKINMGKTPEKVTKDKDPKLVEVARKGREKYMNKLKESILNDVKKRKRRYYQCKQWNYRRY